jgi:hypothetical protein
MERTQETSKQLSLRIELAECPEKAPNSRQRGGEKKELSTVSPSFA